MKIVIEGNPIPQQRHRIARRSTFVTSYDPQVELKKMVKRVMAIELQKAFDSDDKEKVMEASKLAHATNFSIEFSFYLPISESDSEKLKNLKKWNVQAANSKPDFDNLEKFYLDCASNVLYPDDRMITSSKSRKLYSKKPRTEINIKPKEIVLNAKHETIYKMLSPEKLADILIYADTIASETGVSELNLYKESVEKMVAEMEDDERKRWLTHTASLLVHFAENYADILMKIKKTLSK